MSSVQTSSAELVAVNRRADGCSSSQVEECGVVGRIQCDRLTVSGGLLSVCCDRFRTGGICLHRDSAGENVIAIVHSEHCKWCKTGSVRGTRDRLGGGLYTGAYLGRLFQIRVSEAARLTELIAELTKTQGATLDHRDVPITGTPPYCTVADVRHISSVALTILLAFDDEFVWGDNVTFNTKARLG